MQYALNKEDKQWVESFITTLISYYGFEEQAPVHQDPDKLFPGFGTSISADDCTELLAQVSKVWDIKQHKIQISIISDIDFKNESYSLAGKTILLDDFSRLDKLYQAQAYYFKIVLTQSLLKDKQQLISHLNRHTACVALHELSLVDTNEYSGNDLSIDVACVFKGLSLQYINGLIENAVDYATLEHYVPYSTYLLYAVAVLSYLHKEPIAGSLPSFKTYYHNTLLEFEAGLKESGHLSVAESELKKVQAQNKLYEQRETAYRQHDYTTLATILDELEQLDTPEWFLKADRGYLHLQLKHYELAIDYFSQTIKLEPEQYSNYNNRGYCKLQLGLPEAAYQDFLLSQQYNPYNPFLYRNLGAYYLKLNNLPTALKYFTDAMELKADLDLIYFYLAHCNHRLGNIKKAEMYALISRERREHNDSLEPELNFSPG